MSNIQTATFGTGCFWCSEAVFERTAGVVDVRSGYMGGHDEQPTYQKVCTGVTGHAEVVEVKFDPALISYVKLLDLFFRMHDPTTLNRQGADQGTQYRSAIFYYTDEQKKSAEAAVKKVNESAVFADPIVTEISAASTFHPAEDYHEDYYTNNKDRPYCQMVISPKLRKLNLEK
jgi:peptide-methionine (S)-S-oxide reductase